MRELRSAARFKRVSYSHESSALPRVVEEEGWLGLIQVGQGGGLYHNLAGLYVSLQVNG
nr:hypothetical protein 1 [Actinidia virus 1]